MMSQNKIVFIGIFVGLGILIGFLGGQTIQTENIVYISEESGEKVVIEQDLPLISELLLNPVYYEWWASAEGIIVSKDESSMTIEKDGNVATIYIRPIVTKFFKEQSLGASIPDEILFEDIQVGMFIRGGVVMSRSGTTGIASVEDVAFGTSFRVIE